MIRFKCPKCASSLAVNEAKAGALGLCPSCGTKVRVPGGPAPKPSQPAPAPPPPAASAPAKAEEAAAVYGFEAPPEPPPSPRKAVAPRRQPVPDEPAERDEHEGAEEARPARRKPRRKKRRARTDWEMPDLSPFRGVAVGLGLCLILAVLSFVVPGLGYVSVGLGYALGIAGSVWLLMMAFQESVGWGVACLLIPFVSLIFVVTHLDQALKPFLVSLRGGILVAIGTLALGV